MTSTADLVRDIKIIDTDTHFSEPHELWVSRAPASIRGRMPQVKVVDGKRNWFIDGDKQLGLSAMPNSVIRKDGSKSRSLEFLDWQIEDVHGGCYEVQQRLRVMDQANIFAQIVYPNILGFGGQRAGQVDPALRAASIEIYNDAMAELQADSNGRIFPMALLPWWDVRLAVAETERCHRMGLRGLNINSDPHLHDGLPALGDPHWNPLWEAAASLDMPVNFHIGASDTSIDWFGSSPWPGGQAGIRFAIGSTMLFFGNARVMSNILLSGILDRYPKLKFVSVESGIGWIPFVLECLEYQLAENAESTKLSLTPWEYFERNMYACFWFEKRNLASSVRQVGVDNVMFETDFPHPTCLYPEPLSQVASGLSELDFETRRKVLSGNAARLYRIPLG